MPTPPTPVRRGSVLLVAMLLAAIIGISLVSYLRLCTMALNRAQRNFLNIAAMNLCELGLEHALLCLNNNQTQNIALATAWDGWTVRGTNATRTYAGYSPAPGATGVVKVLVQNYDLTAQPLIVAEATVTPGDGSPPLSKFVTITLAKRSIAYGMIAKTSFRGDSNTYIDSWNSAETAAAFVPYSNGKRKANGPVGVVSSADAALRLGDNPTVFGTVNTGGGSPTKSGNAVLSSAVGGTGWNASLVNTSFSYNWPTVTVPTPTKTNYITTPIKGNVKFPRNGDTPAVDGKYYYTFAMGVGIMYAAHTMTITDPCVFIMTNHSGANVIYTSDHATFTYAANGSLDIYTNGNIDIDSGANFFNNKSAARTNIYGTNATSQTFITRGGGNFYANIIAQNADVTLDSGVNYMGAMAVNTIALLGGCGFHYDEALNGSGNGGYKVSQWKELTDAASRATYASLLNF
jgi:hypothetical protein